MAPAQGCPTNLWSVPLKKRERTLKCTDWEGRNKTLSADDTTIYIDNSKELTTSSSSTTKKLLDLISNYSKDVRYKINIQKLTVFLCISNEQLEFESETKNTFVLENTIILELKKCRYKANKRYTRIYKEICKKNLLKEIKDLYKWRDIPDMYITWIERLGILRCQVFPTWSVDSMKSQGKAQQQKFQLFCGNRQTDSTLYAKGKRPRIRNAEV